MPLEPQSLLQNRYRILAELGRGGMGAVYHAHDENLSVDVAIKENLVTLPESERQFKREASLLASLRHTNLPRVIDHFVIPGQGQYLVMDFIPGDDARHIVETRGPVPEAEVVAWGQQILGALAYLHQRPQPVVHRDIKPGNIKITPDGRAVLVDFGLAKQHDTTQQTTTGAKSLTPGFAPPEQYGVGRTEPRTDIYALGATLYNLLTGEMPADSLERAMGTATLRSVRDFNPAISERTAQAIEKALAVRPDERFATAAEFSAALPSREATLRPQAEATVRPTPAAEATVRPGARPGASPAAATPAARPANLLPGALIGGGLVLAMLVGGGLWAGGAFTPPPTSTSTLPLSVTPPLPTVPVVIASPTTSLASPTLAVASPTVTPLAATATPAPTLTPTEAVSPTPAPTSIGGGAGEIAFVSEREGAPQIYLMEADGSNVRRLTNRPDGACQPAWSPDGQTLLFISPCAGRQETYPGAVIFRANADGSDQRQLVTLLGGAFDPEWSPFGLVVTYLRPGRSTPQLHYVDPVNAGDRSTLLSEGQSNDRHGTWSPDGTRLAFSNLSRTGRPTIFWMTLSGEGAALSANVNARNVLSRDVDATRPRFAPNGSTLAFVGNGQIYVIPADAVGGFGALALTTTGLNDWPTWSPDGQFIAYDSGLSSRARDIVRMTARGLLPTPLTTDPAADYQPAWRP